MVNFSVELVLMIVAQGLLHPRRYRPVVVSCKLGSKAERVKSSGNRRIKRNRLRRKWNRESCKKSCF